MTYPVIKKSQIHTICYAICIFLFAIGHTKIQNLNVLTGMMVTYGKFLPAVFSGMILLSNAKLDLKAVGVFAFFVLLLVYSFLKNDLSYVLFFAAFFMMACSHGNEKSIFKAYAITVYSVILFTITLAISGMLENDNSWYGRYDLGFTYCTFGPNLFLSATLSLIAWKRNRMSWKHWMFVLLINQFLFWKTDTDAVYLCVILVFILWIVIHNKRISRIISYNRIVGFLCDNSYTILAVATIALQLYFNRNSLNASMIALNKLLSNRLIMGRDVFLKYGPELRKTIQELTIGLGVDKVSYLDSSYLALLTSYGIPLMVFFCYLMNCICREARVEGNNYLVVCLVVFAVHCITDPQLSSFRANPFIITSLMFFRRGSINNKRGRKKLLYSIRKAGLVK